MELGPQQVHRYTDPVINNITNMIMVIVNTIVIITNMIMIIIYMMTRFIDVLIVRVE